VTIAEWLATRTPVPPDALAERLRCALEPVLQRDAREIPDAALAAAEMVLADLRREGCTCRAQALDLLAADALVTYAFEAASEDPGTLATRADEAMRRIAALAHDCIS
jgi:hypothetical protein